MKQQTHMLYPPLYHKHTHMCSHTISLRLITCPEEGSRAWQSLFLPLRQHTRAPHYNLPLHQQMLQHLENNGRGCFIFQHPNRNCVDFGVQIVLLRKNNKNIVFHDTKNPRFKCFHIEFFFFFFFCHKVVFKPAWKCRANPRRASLFRSKSSFGKAPDVKRKRKLEQMLALQSVKKSHFESETSKRWCLESEVN